MKYVGFLRAIFQVLIGNTDAHGKNVSFFCDEDGLRLAPVYDLVCIDALDAGVDHTYAMAIGDAFSEGDLTPYEWAYFAYLCKVPFRLVAHELGRLADKALAAMDELLVEMDKQSIPHALAQRFKDVVTGSCTRQRAHVQQIVRFKRSDFE